MIYLQIYVVQVRLMKLFHFIKHLSINSSANTQNILGRGGVLEEVMFDEILLINFTTQSYLTKNCRCPQASTSRSEP